MWLNTADHWRPRLGRSRKPALSPQWERHLVLGDGWKVFVRPVRAADEPLVLDLLQNGSKEDLRLRFFDSIKELSHPFLPG